MFVPILRTGPTRAQLHIDTIYELFITSATWSFFTFHAVVMLAGPDGHHAEPPEVDEGRLLCSLAAHPADRAAGCAAAPFPPAPPTTSQICSLAQFALARLLPSSAFALASAVLRVSVSVLYFALSGLHCRLA